MTPLYVFLVFVFAFVFVVVGLTGGSARSLRARSLRGTLTLREMSPLGLGVSRFGGEGLFCLWGFVALGACFFSSDDVDLGL